MSDNRKRKELPSEDGVSGRYHFLAERLSWKWWYYFVVFWVVIGKKEL
jgi:hypothetical protein